MENPKILRTRKSNRFLQTGTEIGFLVFAINAVIYCINFIAVVKNRTTGGSDLELYPPWLYVLMLFTYLGGVILTVIGLIIYNKQHMVESKLKLVFLPLVYGLFGLLLVTGHFLSISNIVNFPVGALYESSVITVWATESYFGAIVTSLALILAIISLFLFGRMINELKENYGTNAKGLMLSPYLLIVSLVFYLIVTIVGAVLFTSSAATELMHTNTYLIYNASQLLIEIAYCLCYLELTFKLIYSKPMIASNYSD